MCLNKEITRKQYNDLTKLKTVKLQYEYIIRNIFEVAETDILVHKKLIRKNNLTPYQYYKIEKNTHYYQKGTKFTFDFYEKFGRYRLEIHEGLHSFVNTTTMWCHTSMKIVEAIIPKGSLYLEGDTDDIVSDNLIFYNLKPVK